VSSTRIRCRYALVLSLFGVLACASVILAPGAEKVHLTSDPSEVVACKVLGEVTVEPAPFQTNAQGHDKLRNAAYALGGNAVLQTFGGAFKGSGRFQGTAYRCDSSLYTPSRRPPASNGSKP